MAKDYKHSWLAFLISTQLTACASLDFLSLDTIKRQFSPQQTIANSKVAPTWQATLPHGGEVQNLQNFWAQFDDALLLKLIEAAQSESASIASARARIAQARATRVTANASLLPSLDASFSASRSLQQGGVGGTSGIQQSQAGNASAGGSTASAFNSYQLAAQAAWELDLFGANSALFDAAKRSEEASQSAWHQARVSVAAEVATSYFNQRYCQAQLALNVADAKSRAETARITKISVDAGFAAKGELSLAEASAADSAQQVKAQQAQCDLGIKELVALTNWDEPTLIEQLASTPFKNSDKAMFSIAEIPAQVIAQRPDIDNAEAELITAAANIKSAQAERLPKVSLNGSIGWMRLSGSGFKMEGETWSIGPVSITLPIFDAGKRKANADSAVAKYEEAAANYRSQVRVAIKEVESALVTLHSSAARQDDIAQAIAGYEAAYQATETKVSAGFANLLELEESRRYALQAKTNQISLLKERNAAWISLYRAAGGGWQRDSLLGTSINSTCVAIQRCS